ncbi:MAG: response regulator [Pirellulales bacterium]
MKPKVLIVEDDERIMESIEDTLVSMEHEHDWVTNQHDARLRLRSSEWDYVLLNLEIPAKANRGEAHTEFGYNLLRDIARIKGKGTVPVIVMTANGWDGLNLAADLYANGASEFIAKPFPTKGRTLASVIRKVLDAHNRAVPTPALPLQKSPSIDTAFRGGELVVHPTRADLDGVTIISDRGTGHCMAVLRQLCRTGSRGIYVRMSGEELANAVGAKGGVGTITGCIQTLRRNIVNRMRNVGVVVGRNDVIDHDQQGYCLRDWIVVGGGDHSKCPRDVPASRIDVPADVPGNLLDVPPIVPGVPANVPAATDWNERQFWILEQVGQDVQLERVMVERQFQVGDKTAKRDLSELVRTGHIKYVRNGRRGYYTLPGTKRDNFHRDLSAAPCQ